MNGRRTERSQVAQLESSLGRCPSGGGSAADDEHLQTVLVVCVSEDEVSTIYGLICEEEE